MSEAVGDVVTVQAPHGKIEARRMGRAEAGQSRWQISYPWGDETFFGTSADLIAHAKKRLAERDPQAPLH